jgi:hypothetical protein
MAASIVAVVSMAAHAQQAVPTSSAPPDDSPRALARPHFMHGLSLADQQEWSEALAEFAESYRISPSASVLFNIGYCQRALGQYVAALETFRRFLAEPSADALGAQRGQAEGFAREIELRVVHLTVVVPEPLRRRAEVSVDGHVMALGGGGELALTLDPGRHTVQVRHEGYRPLFADRDLSAGASERVDVTLERLPARLAVTSNVSGALVRLDGERVGTVPYAADVPPGRRRLEVSAPHFLPHRSVINLVPGAPVRVTADLSREPTSLLRQWWFWSAIGAVVTGAAVTTYVLVGPPSQPPPYEGGSLMWVVGQNGTR